MLSGEQTGRPVGVGRSGDRIHSSVYRTAGAPTHTRCNAPPVSTFYHSRQNLALAATSVSHLGQIVPAISDQSRTSEQRASLADLAEESIPPVTIPPSTTASLALAGCQRSGRSSESPKATSAFFRLEPSQQLECSGT
jgi:hypothetical protein